MNLHFATRSLDEARNVSWLFETVNLRATRLGGLTLFEIGGRVARMTLSLDERLSYSFVDSCPSMPVGSRCCCHLLGYSCLLKYNHKFCFHYNITIRNQ